MLDVIFSQMTERVPFRSGGSH